MYSVRITLASGSPIVSESPHLARYSERRLRDLGANIAGYAGLRETGHAIDE